MKRIVIGIGNDMRRDDAAGLEVARRVRSCPTRESPLGGFELMDMWEAADHAIVVDATHSKRQPGTVIRFDPAQDRLPSGTFASSHAIGVAETIEVARSLGRLPSRLTVYGIEAADLSIGEEMSPAVAAAVSRVAREIDDA